MTEYINALIYIALGLFGALLHWFKQRYVTNTTNKSIIRYLRENAQATFNATGALILAEVNLSLLMSGGIITLSELIGAITAGYMTNSTLNK